MTDNFDFARYNRISAFALRAHCRFVRRTNREYQSELPNSMALVSGQLDLSDKNVAIALLDGQNVTNLPFLLAAQMPPKERIIFLKHASAMIGRSDGLICCNV